MVTEVRDLLRDVVQQQLAARRSEQTRGRSLARSQTQGRFLNTLFLGPQASDPLVADGANFLQDVNSVDQQRCIPRLLCSAVSGIFGQGPTTGVVTPAPPVGPPSPPIVRPPAPPTARPRPPAPPTARPPDPPTARPPAPPTARPPAPLTARPPAPLTARPPAPPTARPPAPPTARPPAPPTARPPAPPTARPRPPAPPTARPRPPAPPTARPLPPPVVRPPAPPVTARPRPPAVRPPAPPVTAVRPPAPPSPPVVGPPAPPGGRPPAPPVGPPAPPGGRPPAPPSDALPPSSEPFFEKPVNTAAFGPPGSRSLELRRPARFDPASRRVSGFAARSPILADDSGLFEIESRRRSLRRGWNDLSVTSAAHGRVLFRDSSGPSGTLSELRTRTDAEASVTSVRTFDPFRSGRSSASDGRGRSGEGRVSGRVRFEDDVRSGRSARQDLPADSRVFSVVSSASDLPSGGRRSSRRESDLPSSGRIRFPERRRRKRTVPIFGSFFRVLNTLAQPYSFSPYTTAALEGSTGGSRNRCAQLYPQCPAGSSQGNGAGDFIDVFNNLNRYVPGGLNALLPPVRVPALDAFRQR